MKPTIRAHSRESSFVFACVRVCRCRRRRRTRSVPARGPGSRRHRQRLSTRERGGQADSRQGRQCVRCRGRGRPSALAVVEPCCSGLGGGGFFLLRRASDGHETMIDLREMAPGAATRDMYLDKDGNAVASLSRDSALAAGIPGEPAGLAYLAKKYGKLPLSVSMAPAIKLARDGFPLYERLRGAVTFKKRRVPQDARCGARVPGQRRSAGDRLHHQAAGSRRQPRAAGHEGRRRLLQGRVREEARRGRAAARRQLDRSGPG